MGIREVKNWIIDLLFPTRCVFCRQSMAPGQPGVCARCSDSIPCLPNGGNIRGKYFVECVSALYYEGAVREAILRYKFSGAEVYAGAFGKLIADCITKNLRGDFDIISWAPLDPWRRRRRGYDQAELLAKETARRLGCKAEPLLKKKRGVRPQSKTGSPEARRANIAGSYRVADAARVKGKRVLLIDDVFTTGATLSECAKTLHRAGVDCVLCATLARTMHR